MDSSLAVCLCGRVEVFHLPSVLRPSRPPPIKHPLQSLFELRADGQVDEEIAGGIAGSHQMSQGHGGVERIAETFFGVEVRQEVPEERMRHGR